MSSLLPFLVTGIVTGSLYGLAGVGLVLTYRTSGVFNFGHGALAAAAAFLFYTLHYTFGWPWLVAGVVVVAAFATVVAFLAELLTDALSDAPTAVVVVATVGVLLLIQGLLNLRYGAVTRSFPEFLPTSGFTLGGVNVSWSQVISVAFAASAALGLYVFLRTSRLGISMRAVVNDPTLVALTGQAPRRVRLAAWAIGCGFAAASGLLLAPTLNLDAVLLTFLVVQAFGACAVGLFSSLPLTYAGGIAVGVVASIATRYLTNQPWSGIPSAMPFLILILVLLIVPPSKLPKQRLTTGSLVPESVALPRRLSQGLGLCVLGFLVLVPTFVGARLPIWTSAMIYVVLFGSLALLVWVSGQISLCHMAFAAVGATSMAHLSEHVPWGLALILAGLVAVPVGALVAVPAIRLSGLPLALVTLGFGVLMQNVVFSTSLMFGREAVVSAPRPVLGIIDGSDRSMYYIALGVAVGACAALVVIYRGRLGRLLRAMAETPTMLATHGLSVNVTRLIVFCISAFLAGVAGALLVTQAGSASGVGFGPLQSLVLLAVLSICGTRLLRSSVLAALLYAVAPGYLTSFDSDQQTFAFGLAAIVASILIAKRSSITDWAARASARAETRPLHGPIRARLARGSRSAVSEEPMLS